MSSPLRWTQRQLVVATGALVASAVGLAATRPDVTLDVQTATVSRGPVDNQIVATGTLQAVSTVDVSSPVAGVVQSLDVDVNTPVHAGDIVARLDASSYETALRDARAAEERARARVLDLQAAEQAARSRLLRDELLAQNVVAHGDLEAVRAATTDATVDLRSAESDLTAAEAAVRAAADDLEGTVIRAPVDGVVIVRNVEVGQTLTATMESPVLFRIAVDLHDMQMAVEMNEPDSNIRRGTPVFLTVESYGNKVFHAEVSQVAPHAAIVEVPNPDERLRPGMVATIVIDGPHHDDAVRVPDAALAFQPPADGATIVDAANLEPDEEGAVVGRREVWRYSHGRLTPVAVGAGLAGGGWTELLTDVLRPGDEVATSVVVRRESWLTELRSRIVSWLP